MALHDWTARLGEEADEPIFLPTTRDFRVVGSRRATCADHRGRLAGRQALPGGATTAVGDGANTTDLREPLICENRLVVVPGVTRLFEKPAPWRRSSM
ncbi:MULTISPECIES: hypothetical protein [unclassified Streptomyces]|uniref:hypothetical protein n=1 Tax=unclassified Streptomyces TaxID=2593676 RepID=UPI00352C96C9